MNFKQGELSAKLDGYIKSDPQYKAVYEYTRGRFEAATDLPAHNWAHAYCDTLNAIVIGESEGANMHIVLPAIIMHDIGFLYVATGKTHGALSPDNAASYLRDGGIDYTPKELAKIASCIRTHKGSMHTEKPVSLEARVVADADMLEKFGPFGVYQNIRTITEIFNHTPETTTGKSLAEPGRLFVAHFFKELKEATEPYASGSIYRDSYTVALLQ